MSGSLSFDSWTINQASFTILCILYTQSMVYLLIISCIILMDSGYDTFGIITNDIDISYFIPLLIDYFSAVTIL